MKFPSRYSFKNPNAKWMVIKDAPFSEIKDVFNELNLYIPSKTAGDCINGLIYIACSIRKSGVPNIYEIPQNS